MKIRRLSRPALALVGAGFAVLPMLQNVSTSLPTWLVPYRTAVWSALGLLTIVWIAWFVVTSAGHEATVTDDQLRRNRRQLLSRVREELLEGPSYDPFYVAHRFTPLLHRRIWNDASEPKRTSTQTHALESDSDLRSLLDKHHGQMVILGRAGAGKSTLLSDICKDLLLRAESDETMSVPVILNLVSWSDGTKTLGEWIQEELHARYAMRPRDAKRCVDVDLVIPLLDGLDEVPETLRVPCIHAINAFVANHPLIVCCRSNDYQHAAIRLDLQAVFEIEAPTKEQLVSFLDAQPATSDDSLKIAADDSLLDLFDTPLMLRVVAAVRNRSASPLASEGTLEERRAHLFAAYVHTMLNRGPRDISSDRRQTLRWLRWTAASLVDHSRGALQLEDLEPAWLQATTVRVAAHLIGAVLCGLIAGVMLFALIDAHAGAIYTGILIGPWIWIAGKSQPNALTWSWYRLAQLLVRWVPAGFVMGIFYPVFGNLAVFTATKHLGRFGTYAASTLGVMLSLSLPFVARRIAWWWTATVWGTPILVTIGVMMHDAHSTPISVGSYFVAAVAVFVAWLSWAGQRPVLRTDPPRVGRSSNYLGRRLVLAFSLAAVMALVPMQPKRFESHYQFIGTLSICCAIIGAVTAAVLAIHDSPHQEDLSSNQRRPNQGTWASIRIAVSLAMSTALAIYLIVGVVMLFGSMIFVKMPESSTELVRSTAMAWGQGLRSIALLSGIVVFWFKGGGFFVRHFVTRGLLHLTDDIPWRYPEFLDRCCHHLLLHRIGGRYVFLHRLILEWFATLDDASLDELGTRRV